MDRVAHFVSGRSPAGWLVLCPLALFIFIDAMGFAMVAPILAAHPVSSSPTHQAIIYGVAMGIFPLATFFAAPVLGTLSDRIGRRPMMIFCGLGLSSTFVVIAVGLLMDSATIVILGRLVGGFMGATQAIALAAMADAGEPGGKDARINIGLLASSLGFVLGPVLAGALAGGKIVPQLAEAEPLIAVFILTVATLVWIRLSVPAGGQIAAPGASLDFLRGLRDLAKTFRSPVLRRLARIFLFQQIGWGAFFFFIAPFLIHRLAFDPARASYYVALLGVGFCLSVAVVMPLLRKHFSARAIGVGAMAITAAGITVSVFLPVPLAQWTVAIPIAIATAAGYGALIMLFTDEAHGNEGEILGVTASINALAFGVTSLAGGVISAASPAGPLVAAAVLMGAATIMLFCNPKPKTTR